MLNDWLSTLMILASEKDIVAMISIEDIINTFAGNSAPLQKTKWTEQQLQFLTSHVWLNDSLMFYSFTEFSLGQWSAHFSILCPYPSKTTIWLVFSQKNLIYYSPEALILAQNAPQTVWRPGSARRCWGSLHRSLRPIAGLRGWAPGEKKENGRGEGEGGGTWAQFRHWICRDRSHLPWLQWSLVFRIWLCNIPMKD